MVKNGICFFKYLFLASLGRRKKKMSMCFPSTPKKAATTIGCFLFGAALFAFGLHFSYVNVAPQQARIKARNDFVRERLRKKYGKP